MDVSSAEQHLALVGMDADQAAAYVRLAISGPMRAADLATTLGVNRQEAYRRIHAMIARGYIVSDLKHPATFSATPPSEIFARAMTSEQAKVQQLTHADARITEALATMRPDPPTHAAPTFAMIRGRGDVLSKASSIISAAQNEVRIISTHAASVNLADLAGIIPLLHEKATSGLRVRAIVRPDAALDDRVLAIAPNIMEVRVIEDGAHGGMLIADGNAVLMSLVSDVSKKLHAGEDVSLWSDASDLAALLSLLFDALWARAEPPRSRLSPRSQSAFRA